MMAVLGGAVTFTVLVTYVPFKVSTALTHDLSVGFEKVLNAVADQGESLRVAAHPGLIG